MNALAIIENAPAVISAPTLPTAAWDLVTLIENAKSYLGVVGGGVIGFIGLLLIIIGAILIAVKLWGNQQNQGGKPWLLLAAMIFVGGVLTFGGVSLLLEIAEGGKTSIEELGGGFILFTGGFGLGR